MIWKDRGDFGDRDVGKFLGFEFMKAPAVNPAFCQEAVWSDLVEKVPDAAYQVLVMGHCAGKNRSWVHGQIDIGNGGA